MRIDERGRRGIGRALALAVLVWACAGAHQAGAVARGVDAKGGGGAMRGAIIDVEEALAAIRAVHPQADPALARRGVEQVARFWRPEDGDQAAFVAFCREQYVADDAGRLELLDRFDRALEAIAGHRVVLTRTLREWSELDRGPQTPVDLLFSELDPFDHLIDDAFRTKVAFVALLHFPALDAPTLDATPELSRRAWAEARLARGFGMRVPGALRQDETRAFARADDYIAHYNVHTERLIRADGSSWFPGGPRLISHWGLRDHLKALYADPAANLARQRVIQAVMERIVRQEIPAAVIDRDDVAWDPLANRLYDVGARAPRAGQAAREPDTRFARWLDVFHAERAIDPHSAPTYSTFLERRFLHYREMTWQQVERLLLDVIEAPVAADVAAVIQSRLGRPLEPFDIWYDGFKARGSIAESELNAAVRARYPSLEAFEKDLDNILIRLGFSAETAGYLAARIAVDPARGAGHAMGASMRTDKAHLRTRVPAGGMDYKGYNIALHELGHCVEQTFSLYRVDRVLMGDVPNVAFTEAFAFLFQHRDLDVLGLGGTPTPEARALATLDAYWATREIAGVGLVDMYAWRWMYEHPNATPADLRQAVVAIAAEVWDRHYAPLLGHAGTSLLGIYSHMIASGLYLPDYTLGHLIQFQIERYLEGRDLATEMERMLRPGRVTPDAWMRHAVGAPVSARPLVDAAAEALTRLR